MNKTTLRLAAVALVVLLLPVAASAAQFSKLRLTGDMEVGSRKNSYTKFTLDSATGNIVVAGTAAIGGNVTMAGDLAVTGTITGAVVATFAAGTEATPGIRWTTDTDSGHRLSGANAMALVLAGSDVVDYTTSGVAVTGTFSSSGAATLASLVCTAGATFGGGYGSTGTTISTAGVGQFNGALTTDGALTADSLVVGGGYGSTGFSASNAGVLQADGAITTDSTLTANLVVVAVGAVGTPSIYFSGDSDSGPYWIGANNYGFAAAGAKVLDIGTSGLGITGTVTASGAGTVDSLVCTTSATFGGGFGSSGTSVSTAGAIQTDAASEFDGGFTVDDTLFVVTDATGVVSGVPTSTTTDAWTIDGSATTSGCVVKIKVDDDNLASGYALMIFGGASADTEQFSVAEAGVVYSLGKITATGGLDTGTGFSGTGVSLTAAGAGSFDTTLTVTGAAAFNGGIALDTSVFTVADTTGALSSVPTTTDGNAWTIDGTTLTSGNLIKLIAVDATLASGYYINVFGGTNATSVWSLGEGGATLITPNVATIEPLYIDGTVTTTADLVTLKAVDATLNAGLYIECLGGAGSTSVFSVGESGVTRIVPTVSQAAVDTLTIQSILNTTGDLLALVADDDELAGGKYILALGGASYDTEVFSVGEDGITAITNTATSTDALTITNLTMTDGNLLSLVADDDEQTTGLFIECLGTTDHATVVFSVASDGATVIMGDITGENAETISNNSDGYWNLSGILNPVAFMRDTVTNTDGSEDAAIATSGNLFIATKSDGTTTFTVPAPASGTVGCVWYFLQTEDQTMKITAVGGDDTDCFVTKNSQDSDWAAFDQAGEKIGAYAVVIGLTATKHGIYNLSDEGMTLTVTDTD